MPKRVQELLGLKPGDKVAFDVVNDAVKLVPIRSRRLGEHRGAFRTHSATDLRPFRKRRAEELADKLRNE